MKSKLIAALAALMAAPILATAPANAENNAPWPLGPAAYTLAPDDCDNLYDDYMNGVGEAVQDLANGDNQRASEDIAAANQTYMNAKSGGCGWAWTMTSPKITLKPPTPVTVVQR